MTDLVRNPLFGLGLCIAGYAAGQWLNRRLRTPLANPLLIAIVLCSCFLVATGIEFADFNRGGWLLTMFLAPATASLAVTVYRRREVMREALAPILAGCAAGAAVSMASVSVLSRVLELDTGIMISLLPKSVTTPIAVSLSEKTGGLPAVTVAAVLLTGIVGAVLAPYLIRLLRLNDPIVAGVAIGTSSHAIGTTKALELGELYGAASGISIGVTGIVTTFYFMLI